MSKCYFCGEVVRRHGYAILFSILDPCVLRSITQIIQPKIHVFPRRKKLRIPDNMEFELDQYFDISFWKSKSPIGSGVYSRGRHCTLFFVVKSLSPGSGAAAVPRPLPRPVTLYYRGDTQILIIRYSRLILHLLSPATRGCMLCTHRFIRRFPRPAFKVSTKRQRTPSVLLGIYPRIPVSF